MKGASDGGIFVPHSEGRFPGFDPESKELDAEVLQSYIYGGHIAEFMEVRCAFHCSIPTPPRPVVVERELGATSTSSPAFSRLSRPQKWSHDVLVVLIVLTGSCFVYRVSRRKTRRGSASSSRRSSRTTSRPRTSRTCTGASRIRSSPSSSSDLPHALVDAVTASSLFSPRPSRRRRRRRRRAHGTDADALPARSEAHEKIREDPSYTKTDKADLASWKEASKKTHPKKLSLQERRERVEAKKAEWLASRE